jgi:hypothetical protein
VEVSQAEFEPAVFARPITPAIIAPYLRDAKANHEELLRSGVIDPAKLKPYEALFSVLEIKE